MLSGKIVGRTSLYRRVLVAMREAGVEHVFSHELASKVGGTAAQVRRDLMTLGCTGSPARGYAVEALVDRIGRFLDPPAPEPVVLVGIGNLGRALLSHFTGRRPGLAIVAAFDSDPQKVNRTIGGCPALGMDELGRFVTGQGVRIGVLTVPAGAAQETADQLVRAGVRGILNFAPAALRVPRTVYVDNMDMTMSLEKVAYYARQQGAREAAR